MSLALFLLAYPQERTGALLRKLRFAGAERTVAEKKVHPATARFTETVSYLQFVTASPTVKTTAESWVRHVEDRP